MSPLVWLPEPYALPSGYPRHTPSPADLRTALAALVGGRDWAELGWPELIEALLALGRTDIGLGRLGEGHIDAARIAGQAGGSLAPDAIYGVWASRSGDSGIRCRRMEGGLLLHGTLKFASGAGVIDRALVPVWPSPEEHLLLDLDVADRPVDRTAWQTRAMTTSHSHTVELSEVRVPADAVVGATNFYLERPGFFPGGIGVAAVWAGGLGRVVDTVLSRVRLRPSPAADLRLGRLLTALSLSVAAVRQAARELDTTGEFRELATRTRAGVGSCVRAALAESRELAGAAGLAYDADLTHAIDDLGLYVLQQSADGDAGYLGDRLRHTGGRSAGDR